ncbi:hypothetical protein C6B37_02365, partial [Candidatus Phytoplasma phoenicium]
RTDKFISFLEKILTDNIEIINFLEDFINFLQNLFINNFKKMTKKTNILQRLELSQINNIFQILFELKNMLKNLCHKKKLLIVFFIRIHHIIVNDNNNHLEFNPIKTINNDENKMLITNSLESSIQNTNDSLSKTSSLPTIQKNPKKIEKENNFIYHLKTILLNADEKAKENLIKGWKQLKNFPKKELAKIARDLFEAQLLIVSNKKEIILACSEEHYINLLKEENKNIIIKKIFNTKKELVKDYLIILKKDWEKVIKPIYLNFIQSKNIHDLNLSSFNTNFYEQNVILNIKKHELTDKNSEDIPLVLHLAQEMLVLIK